VARSAQKTYRYYKARFQIEFLIRDAKRFTSLSACLARFANKWCFHFNESLSALSFAMLESRRQTDQPGAPFSIASLERHYFNQYLIG